jgi:hypothetical protein
MSQYTLMPIMISMTKSCPLSLLFVPLQYFFSILRF